MGTGWVPWAAGYMTRRRPREGGHFPVIMDNQWPENVPANNAWYGRGGCPRDKAGVGVPSSSPYDWPVERPGERDPGSAGEEGQPGLGDMNAARRTRLAKGPRE